MKNNNNSKSFSSVVINLLVLIFSLVGMTVIINWISEKVSTWIADLLFPEEKKEDQKSKTSKIEALKPLLKEAIKHADHYTTIDEIEKSTTREVVDIDQVPERIREKIESYEEAQKASGTKTIINGKIYDNEIDQFIYDCKELKRSKIGSHRVIADKDDVDMAKYLKSKLTKMEQMAPEYFDQNGFNRHNVLLFTNEYFTRVNDYITSFDLYIEKVSFEETDEIINKYFGEV